MKQTEVILGSEGALYERGKSTQWVVMVDELGAF